MTNIKAGSLQTRRSAPAKKMKGLKEAASAAATRNVMATDVVLAGIKNAVNGIAIGQKEMVKEAVAVRNGVPTSLRGSGTAIDHAGMTEIAEAKVARNGALINLKGNGIATGHAEMTEIEAKVAKNGALPISQKETGTAIDHAEMIEVVTGVAVVAEEMVVPARNGVTVTEKGMISGQMTAALLK